MGEISLSPNDFTKRHGLSLYDEATSEVKRHKWIRSEQAGHDLGEEAVRDWVQQHWLDYLRERWLEHIQGFRFWVELEMQSFGVLQRAFPEQTYLLNHILERLKRGEENLDIILWACNTNQPLESIQQILIAIDMNRLRLLKFFTTKPV